MTPKAVKISEENYHWLAQRAGELQRERGEPVSLDEALSALRATAISDLAGSWRMSDKEAEQIHINLKEGWKRWKLKSV